MSNIYNLEPKTHGLITIKTNFGDIEVELFTKECPKATRNFVQNCLDGIFKGRSLERVEKDFIAVIGLPEDEDPCERFRDEFHPRLKFNRRGLIATANADKDENTSKFFFTLGPTPELQNKHSIFGRAKGDSIYRLVDLNESQVDEDLRPISEKTILETDVIENPFPDLKPNLDLKYKATLVDDDDEEEDDPILRPKPKLGDSKKLSFYDDSDEDEAYNIDDTINSQGRSTKEFESNIQRPELRRTDDNIAIDTHADQRHESQSKTEQETETINERERRLREIKAQIQEIKNQFDNESKSKSLSERRRERDSNTSDSSATKRHLLESSGLSNESLDPEYNQVVTRIADKRSRSRQNETKEMIESFKKKLKEASSSSDSGRRCDSGQKKQYKLDQADAEDLKLLEDLDRVDGDDWMNHKFQPLDAGDDDDDPSAYKMIDTREQRLVEDESHDHQDNTPENSDDQNRGSKKVKHRRDEEHIHRIEHKRHRRDDSLSDRKSHKHSRRHTSRKHHHRGRDSSEDRRSRR